MEIKQVDPFDEAALADWHAAWSTGAAAGREDPPIWGLAEMTVRMRDDDPGRGHGFEAFAAVEDGTVVGAGNLEYPLHDNPTLAEIEVDVLPGHRRRGVGDALFAFTAARAAELGRTGLTATVQQPIGAAEVPGVAFATKHGFSKRNVYMCRKLDLPVAAELLDSLAATARQHLTGYRIESWLGPCPESYVEQYTRLRALILVEAPTGDMDLEPEVWDVARLRAEEELVAKQDRTILTSVAIAKDGSLAGHTQLVVPGHEAGRVYQWDTLVLGAHRGHRLGLALKVANLRFLGEHFDDRTNVMTWNAEQNGPMNAVNAQLGFRAVEQAEEWQRDAR